MRQDYQSKTRLGELLTSQVLVGHFRCRRISSFASEGLLPRIEISVQLLWNWALHSLARSSGLSIFRSGYRTQGDKHCNKQITVEFCLEQATGASDRNAQHLMSEPGLHHNDVSMQLVFCQYGSWCEQLWFTGREEYSSATRFRCRGIDRVKDFDSLVVFEEESVAWMVPRRTSNVFKEVQGWRVGLWYHGAVPGPET